MAGIGLVFFPALLGIGLGGAVDATIVCVPKTPTLQTLAMVHGIGSLAAAYSYLRWTISENQRRERGGGPPDFEGVPGTFFWGAFTLVGIACILAAMLASWFSSAPRLRGGTGQSGLLNTTEALEANW